MRQISLFALLLILLSSIPLHAGSLTKPAPSQNGATSEQEVLRDLETILDLWRDGKYDDLFERTAGGKDSRELFTRKLVSAPRRPACCWEKMQDTQVSLKGEQVAMVRARLGFEGSIPGTVFVTKRIKLNKEGGLWTISQSELFSLANLSKKRTVYKYLPIRGK
jgi:hypothetical protein